MRLYSIAVVSLTVGAPNKWTDNLLSQYDIHEVVHHERGVPRGVSWSALVRIAMIRAMNEHLGCGVRESVALSKRLMDGEGRVDVAPFLGVHFDRRALEASLQARLADALESAPRPRRGRPSRRSGQRA